MPFVNMDDNFPDHPKVSGLSDAAFRLHVSGILYCARHLTDGLIAADEVPRLVRKFKRGALTELADRAMWIPVLDGAYSIHDYLDWNDSREKVLKQRARAAERKRKWRESHG